MDGNIHDFPNTFFHNLLSNQRKGLKTRKLDDIFLGDVEYHMDVSRNTQLSHMDYENLHDIGDYQFN